MSPAPALLVTGNGSGSSKSSPRKAGAAVEAAGWCRLADEEDPTVSDRLCSSLLFNLLPRHSSGSMVEVGFFTSIDSARESGLSPG